MKKKREINYNIVKYYNFYADIVSILNSLIGLRSHIKYWNV